jgi:CheY-like chemotaxis protein
MANEGFNILIVDDNEMNRDTLARRLRQQGFTTTLASDGREALHVIKAQLFDLVLLDIMMPEVDGYEVLQTLKADPELCNVPVIMISALEEIESVMKCMEMGAEDYLTKPFDPVLLKAAIARCLKKSPTPLPPPPITGQKTLLQATVIPDKQITASDTEIKENFTIEEVVSRVVKSGRMSRKGYMHLSKAIFNATFSNRTLTEKECNQINFVFSSIRAGQVKIVD